MEAPGHVPSVPSHKSGTEYWRDTIWQRTAQYMLTWRRRAEAFAQPRDNIRLPN